MKSIILISFLIAAATAFGQPGAGNGTPPKKASKIIVLVKDSANNLLDKIATELFDLGYTIESKDEKSKFIITKERPSKRFGTITRIRARINDTAIVFTSQIAINSDTDILGTKEASKTFYDVDYRGGKKNPMLDAWNELEAIARKLSDKIVYSK
jgi:hypothetical protein